MAQREAYLTKEGLEKLQAELETLHTVRRQEVAERIQRAKEIGGTVDNADYDEAKNEQAFVEGRILTLQRLISNAIVISQEHTGDVVKVGSQVSVRIEDGRKQKFTIVGSTETDPVEGRISNESPIGKALLRRHAGEVVEAKTPGGVVRLTILAVE